MFYKWWSRVNKEKEQAMTEKVVNRNPDAAMFSVESRTNSPLTNPIAGSTAPAAAAAPQAAPTLPAEPVAAVAQVTAAPPAVPASPVAIQEAPAAAPVNASAAVVPEAAPPPAEPAPAALLASAAALRDPTLSPYDVYQLEQIEYNKKFRQSEVQEAVAESTEVDPIQRPVRREIPVENTIKLQGIISTPQGNKAIVDGEMVSEGDVIGKVKVLRITSQGVTFLHKKRKFMKPFSK